MYEVKPSNGALVNSTNPGYGVSFHLTLDPNNSRVYTSTFRGPLETVPIVGGGINVANPGTTTTITGAETGITQVAFAPGKVFYVNGSPNGGGSVGLINVNTGFTQQLSGGVTSAHGMVYDTYTGLITMFGAGHAGSIDPGTFTIKDGFIYNGDFDQGAVDGKGHAFVAGSGAITLIDYSLSHDITHPDYVQTIGGFGNIDDLAPLIGAGSQNTAPVPPSVVMLATGCVSLFGYGWRRKKLAA